MKRRLYCCTCRDYYLTWDQRETYAVIHKTDSNKHLHPLSREEITREDV